MMLASHTPSLSLDLSATQSPKPLPDLPEILEHQGPQEEKQLEKTDQDKEPIRKETVKNESLEGQERASKLEKRLSEGERAGKERQGEKQEKARAIQRQGSPYPRTSHPEGTQLLSPQGRYDIRNFVDTPTESSPSLTREPSYSENYSEEPIHASPAELHSRPSEGIAIVGLPTLDGGKSWYAPSPRVKSRSESEQQRTPWYIPPWLAGIGARSSRSTSSSNPSSPLSPEREARQNEDSEAFSEKRVAEIRRMEMKRWEKIVKAAEEEMTAREGEVKRKEEEMMQLAKEMMKKEEEVDRGKEDIGRREEEISRWGEELRRQQEEVKKGKAEVEQREEQLARREEEIRKKEEEGQRKFLLMEKRLKVAALLNETFRNKEHYRRLLSCSGAKAQRILDAFQLLLDTENFPSRAQMIAAMRRLSETTDLYPTRFSLDGPVPALEDEPVASGSYADVYKVLFQGEETCCKVIRVYQRSLTEHMSKVYAREAIVWGQLSHPNILPFYGITKFRSRISFVSRWAKNGDLGEYLTHNPDANRILLCDDVAAGVEYLHSHNIVHGDLKGLNVLVDGSGRACVGDFGLSSVSDPQIIKWTSQSTIASKGGTTRWQAPELLEPEDVVDKVYNSKASDVYAWASICYEIFTGHLPFFETLTMGNVRKLIMQGQTPTRPQQDDPAWSKHGLNDRIWGLMMDCWSLRSSERPDMTMVITRFNGEKPVDYRLPGEWEKNDSMHFRNAQDVNLPKDWFMFWEDLESLLLCIVPGI